MEEHLSQAVAEPHASDDFARTLAQRRQQAIDLLAAQRAQVDRLESDFDAALADVEEHFAADFLTDGQAHADLDQAAQDLRQRSDELSRRETDLSAERAEIAQQHAQLELQREQIESRAAELDALAAKIRQAERDLAAAQEEHQHELEQLTRRRSRLDEQQARLEKEQEDLEARCEKSRAQRHRIAQQLRSQRAESAQQLRAERKEIAAEREALEQESVRARAQLRRDREQLTEESASLDKAGQKLRRDREQFAADQATFQETQKKLDEARRKHGKKHREPTAELQAAQHQMAELLKQRDAFAEHIVTLEQQLATAEKSTPAEGGADTEKSDELQRRLQIAMDDVRELKHRNAELEEGLTAYRSAGKPGAVGGVEKEDWATTRRRMMTELEGVDAQKSPISDDDRLTIEGAIRITDDIVAQREREIADLKQHLADQQHRADEAAGARTAAAHAADADIAEVLDKDELVRQERERLLALQTEWQEKLRQAEVEVSVERARLARERTELEAKRHTLTDEKSALDTQQASLDAQRPGGPGSKVRKLPALRWLDRMGLKEREKD